MKDGKDCLTIILLLPVKLLGGKFWFLCCGSFELSYPAKGEICSVPPGESQKSALAM